MITFRNARRHLRNLVHQEDGTLTLEFLILSPLMVWTFVATLAYFDAFRTEAITQKAAITIADMISREDNAITDAYVDGAYGLLSFLTLHDKAPQMRVSVLRYHVKNPAEDDTEHYHVVWSEVRGMPTASPRNPLVASDLTTKMNSLPKMGNEDRLILVETWTDFDSPYNLGLRTVWGGNSGQSSGNGTLKGIEMASYIFSAPRLTQTCFNNTPGDETTALC